MTRHLPHADSTVEMRRAIQCLERTFFDDSSDVDHDATTNFVAAEHIDHSGVSVLAGTGLAGGGTLEASRTLALSHLGLEALADPGADRIAFWDESAGAFKWLSLGANLEIVNTDLNVTGIVIDHGALAGLGDDDHAQYLLANGTRNLSGNLAVDAAVTIDGRDLSVDGGKLDGIEALADVTDAVNVAAAGAAMAGGAFHDGFSDYVAAEHLSLPNTIANVLTDHDLAAHTGLGLFDSSADVDHGGVGGLGDDDHTQYFLADGSRGITGPYTFQPATHAFLFTHNSVSAGGNRCRLAIQGQTAGEQTFIDLYTNDGDATDDVGVVVWGMGLPDNNTNSELLEFRYDAANNEFAMDTLAGGTGSVRPITLYTSGNRGQFRVAAAGRVTFKPTTHEFLFRDNSISAGGNKPRLAIQPQTSGQQMFLDIFTKDGDSTDDVGVTIWAKGSPTATTNGELLEFRYDSGNAEFAMDALHGGTGTSRPIGVYTSGNRGQLHLAADGSISMSGALGVTGNITGPNVSSGADPGHTHTGSSVCDHDGLTGLGDDDHTQYFLASGARNLGGSITLGADATYDIGTSTVLVRNTYSRTLQTIGNSSTETFGIYVQNTKPTSSRQWYLGPCGIGVADTIALRDVTGGVNLIECDFDAKIRLLGRTRIGTGAAGYHSTCALSVAHDVTTGATYAMGLAIQGTYISTSHSAYGMWIGATLQGNNAGQINGFYAGCCVNVATGQTVYANAGKIAALTKTGSGTVTVAYGMYLQEQTVGVTNWQLYNEDGNNFLGPDDSKSFFGTGFDASVYYDGSDLIIDPDEVGSGKVKIGATANDEIDAGSYSVGGAAGASGSFTTTDGKTVTVTSGIVTSIV